MKFLFVSLFCVLGNSFACKCLKSLKTKSFYTLTYEGFPQCFKCLSHIPEFKSKSLSASFSASLFLSLSHPSLSASFSASLSLSTSLSPPSISLRSNWPTTTKNFEIPKNIGMSNYLAPSTVSNENPKTT